MSRSRHSSNVSIEMVHETDRSRVIAAGEMDLASVVALNRAMSEASSRDLPVHLDLSGVTFVDSRFSAAVGGWERELGPERVRLDLPADPRLQRLLGLRTRSSFRSRPVGK
jgi:ABC-type transporter Mla MlaB component